LTTKEIYIFSNSSHFEWRAGLSDTILKGDHPRTIPAKFALIWFSGFRGDDLNVIFYQNMSNLYNWYKSVERKISQKNPEYMLNYSFPWFCMTDGRRRRRTPSDGKSSHGLCPDELKSEYFGRKNKNGLKIPNW
jgi:hypothetical protein